MTTLDRVNTKLQSLRHLLRNLILMAGLSRVILIVLGMAVLCFLTDYIFKLPAGWRLTFVFGFVCGALSAVYWFLARPMLVPMRDDDLALLFERRFPELSDVLISAVQLAGADDLASPGMVRAVLTRAESASEDLEPGHVPKRRKLNRVALGAAAAICAAVAFCIASPTSANIFAARYLNPYGPARWPRDTALVIEVAGSQAHQIAVPRGEQVAVKVTAVNARRSPMWTAPRTVRLDYEYDAGEKDSRPMRRVEGGVYEAYFNDVTEGLVIRARGGDAETGQVRINVVELPEVQDVWLSLEYPKYTGKPPVESSHALNEITALAGTTVKVRVRASTALAQDGAQILIDTTGPAVMTPTEGGAAGPTHEGEFVLAKGMKWFRIELTDPAGLKNRTPRTFQVRVVEDMPPAVQITKPGGPTRCTPYAVVPLEITAKDDLGLRAAWLHYALGPKEKPRRAKLDLYEEAPREARIKHPWDISELGVKVGQTISYRAEAEDFCDIGPSGTTDANQVGRSQEYYLTIVSTADLASELDQRLFALRDEVKKVKAGQEGDRRKIIELLQRISQGLPMTNDERAVAADTENVQRELARTTDRIATEVARVRERMQNNRIGSFADRRRLDETRGTLEDIATADMPRAADFVKSARKDLASTDGRDNLQNAAGIQKTILDRIDKVLADMSHNEGIDNLVRAARELLRTQRAIKTDTNDFAKRPDTFGAAPDELKPADLAALRLLVRNQNGARDDIKNLEQDMLNVQERLKDIDPKRAELVREAQVQASRDQIRVMMEEAATMLAANRIGLAGQNEDTAIKGLERLLQTLENARQESGNGQALARAIQDVKSALEEVLRLRKEQEGHASDAAEINKNADQAEALKALRRQLNKLRAQQDRVNADASDKSKLDELYKQENELAAETADTAKQLDNEAKAADDRNAPQAGDVKNATKATQEAGSKMTSAQKGMKASNPSAAAESGKQASAKLAEAEEHVADAIKTIEKTRLAQTKETAIKQGETRKQAEEVAGKLGQLAKDNENVSKDASEGLGKAGEQVGQAGGSMGSAQANLDRNDAVQGEKDATEAAQKLAEAEKDLRELRDALEKKQKEQKLLDLIVELQPMLEKQIGINDETRRIDAATAGQNLPEPSRPDKVRLGQLAGDENQLGAKADELLSKVEGEDAPVFAWGFEKIGADLKEAETHLATFETGAYTQDVQQDIADTLKMLIHALKREQSDMQKEGDGGGGEGGGSGGGKRMLVPPAAQLKLLKARELEIHNNTKRIELKRLVKPEKDLSALEKKRVKRLAKEQSDLGELTNELAEALERMAKEQQGAQQ